MTVVASIDRLDTASNGRVAWCDVAAFTLLALVLLRVVAALVLEGLFPRVPDLVIDLVDNHTPLLAAVLMLLLVSKEGLRGSLRPLGARRFHSLTSWLSTSSCSGSSW